MINEAIILAGGLGTRLQGVVKDVPKPMATVGGKPFLEYLLLYLKNYGVTRIILSVGYKYEVIKDFFGTDYHGIELLYAVENEPLGTGGGIQKAIEHAKGDNLFLLNGDSLFNVDLKQLQEHFLKAHAHVCLSLKKMTRFDRYGIVETNSVQVTGFKEKEFREEGYINGGVYAISRSLFSDTALSGRFSFENDYLAIFKDLHTFGFIRADGFFIDIGVPEDYERAQLEVPAIIKNK